jgi:hypothetical protein
MYSIEIKSLGIYIQLDKDEPIFMTGDYQGMQFPICISIDQLIKIVTTD